jgi:transcriptional regulator with XRE-family HTH domain
VATRTISKQFGIAVKRHRLGLGFSQERLAELSKLHPTYIGMIERGTRNPTLEAAAKIAGALNIGLPALIAEAISQKPVAKGSGNGT